MFEGMPYTNFHELNTDWIIKIAKDFLDQYTNIQQTITQGLEDLESKEQQLEALLDAWYTEHSDDIANQLADALRDLNAWYTEHQGYLDQTLQDNITAFGAAADAKAAETIATIPDDYSALSAQVTGNTNDIADQLSALLKSAGSFNFDLLAFVKNHSVADSFIASYGSGAITSGSGWTAYDRYIAVNAGTAITILRNGQISGAWYDDSKTFISGFANAQQSTDTISLSVPSGAAFMRVSTSTSGIDDLHVYNNLLASPALDDEVIIPNFISGECVAINPTNYATLLPDVNNITYSSVFKMYFSAGSADIPEHLPFPRWCSNKSAMLFTMWKNNGSDANIAGGQQLLIANNFVFHRDYTSSWSDWEAIYCEVNIGTGYGTNAHFGSLTETVLFATKYKNVIINAYNGDFNLVNEFKAIYGDDFFDNYTASTRPRGLHLSNGVHIKCSGNTVIRFQYTGNNQHVMQQFSPINYLSDCKLGFTLENAMIVCSNCRYGIHDDPGDSTTPYNNKYIGCFVEIDNRNNTYWTSTEAIAGGCGRNGHVTVENCILRVVSDTPVGTDRVASYHSDVSTTSGRSTVTFKDNILYGGTFIAYYGGARIDFIICNNSMYGPLQIVQIPGAEYPNNNNVHAWNNVDRS